jgi:hypothetical protein
MHTEHSVQQKALLSTWYWMLFRSTSGTIRVLTNLFGLAVLPQVCRVYIGSFNGLKPIREDINPNCVPLFRREQVPVLQC